MYAFFMAGYRFPVPPPKINLKIKNKNETVDLINGSEINLLKAPGLTDVTFDLLLPMVQYPWANYPDGFRPGNHYLDILELLKTEQKTFQLDIYRQFPNGVGTYATNMSVSMEGYEIEEDAEEGFDINVKVSLKQFQQYGTKVLKLTEDGKTYQVVRASTKSILRFVEVKPGDSLFEICKREFNRCDEEILQSVYEINQEMMDAVNLVEAEKTGYFDKYMIHPGQILRLYG